MRGEWPRLGREAEFCRATTDGNIVQGFCCMCNAKSLINGCLSGLDLCILKDHSSCFVENGLKEGKVTRRLLQQFRWEILMTWTKVLMLKMERREQGRRSNWLDVVAGGTWW